MSGDFQARQERHTNLLDKVDLIRLTRCFSYIAIVCQLLQQKMRNVGT
jgi:hypothetical protein